MHSSPDAKLMKLTFNVIFLIQQDFGELYFDYISVMGSVDATSFCQKVLIINSLLQILLNILNFFFRI